MTDKYARTGWLEWLSKYDWHHFAGLTIEDPDPDRVTARRLKRSFQDYIDRLQGLEPNLWWAYVIDRGADRLHIHAVLGGTEGIPQGRLESAWKCGAAKVGRARVPSSLVYLVKKISEDRDIEIDRHIDRHIRQWRAKPSLPNADPSSPPLAAGSPSTTIQRPQAGQKRSVTLSTRVRPSLGEAVRGRAARDKTSASLIIASASLQLADRVLLQDLAVPTAGPYAVPHGSRGRKLNVALTPEERDRLLLAARQWRCSLSRFIAEALARSR